MEKAPWELLILCLMSLDTSSPHFQKEELQSLLDTGLSPKQGLLAYIRLLEQVRLVYLLVSRPPALPRIFFHFSFPFAFFRLHPLLSSSLSHTRTHKLTFVRFSFFAPLPIHLCIYPTQYCMQVRRRTELWEDVPDHMKIYDTELLI